MAEELATWKWHGGILNGFGDACWQEKEGKIRRLTSCRARHPSGQGILLSKAMFGDMVEMGHENAYDAAGLVIIGRPLQKKNASDLDQMWSSLILNPGGNGR